MKSAREPDVRQRDDLRLRQRQRLITTSAGKALAYDGVGRVWSSGVPGQATRFLYDGQEVIAEYNVSGTLLRRYVHGPGVDEPLVWYEGADTSKRSHLYADRQGSIVATAGDSGALTGINAYDEYGLPNATMTGRFGYTGQKFLSEIGLYDYKARIYSPTLGRFLQPDPTGYGPGMNLYAYGNGNPVNATDPSGLDYHYSVGSSITACAQDPGDLGFGGNPDITDDLSAEYNTAHVNCYTTGQNYPTSESLTDRLNDRLGDRDRILPQSTFIPSSLRQGLHVPRQCNSADIAS